MDIDAMVIRSVDREMVQRLSCRSDRRGLLQLAGDVSLLCATAHLVWATRGSVWLAPAVMLHGVTLNFLFCPLHESIHRTAFASRCVNDWVARLGGALLVLPPEYFRLFHFAHHCFSQYPAQDPELLLATPVSMSSYFWRASGLPNWQTALP
jgi:fatty acid desaturase